MIFNFIKELVFVAPKDKIRLIKNGYDKSRFFIGYKINQFDSKYFATKIPINKRALIYFLHAYRTK